MNLTEVQLKEIETLSGIFLEPEEIAVLMDLDEPEFMNDISRKKGEAWKLISGEKLKARKIFIPTL